MITIMLTIKRLRELQGIIKVSAVAKEAGLNAKYIQVKLHRDSELSEQEGRKMIAVIERYGLRQEKQEKCNIVLQHSGKDQQGSCCVSQIDMLRKEKAMARNTGGGSRRGSVNSRTQVQLPNGNWAKRDTSTGRILDVKSDKTPFKGVAKEKDDRRD